MPIMVFELYDYSSSRCLLHQEMTPEEAEQRNRQLRAKGTGQQWILCEDYELTGCCIRKSKRVETVR